MNARATSAPASASKNIKLGYIFMGVAGFLAVVTGLVFYSVMSRPAEKAPAIPTRPIVVAREYIPIGTTIQPEDLKVVEWPESHLPKGELYDNTTPLVGRVARNEIYADEPVYRVNLAGEYSTGGLKVLIPKGLRAMTVAVSEVKGVAGFVKAGDRVDVVATFKNVGSGDSKTQMTKTVLQNVLVIAAAQEMAQQESPDELEATDKMAAAKPDAEEPAGKKEKENAEKAGNVKAAKVVTSFTLAVTPEQIEKLALADESGAIRVVLRPEEDATTAVLSGVNREELLGQSAPVVTPVSYSAPQSYSAPAAPVFRGRVIEFVDGTQKSSVEI